MPDKKALTEDEIKNIELDIENDIITIAMYYLLYNEYIITYNSIINYILYIYSDYDSILIHNILNNIFKRYFNIQIDLNSNNKSIINLKDFAIKDKENNNYKERLNRIIDLLIIRKKEIEKRKCEKEKRKETKKSKEPYKKELYDFETDSNLPSSLSGNPKFIEVWKEFVLARKEDMRKPMTKRAAKQMLGRLQKYKAQGHSPIAMLERSIRNSWQDVYPERKGNYRGVVKNKKTRFNF